MSGKLQGKAKPESGKAGSAKSLVRRGGLRMAWMTAKAENGGACEFFGNQFRPRR
jgi:hypothetical protein